MSSGRRNRVAPDGSFHAVRERGGMLGNRGRLLRADGTLAREWQVRRWIVCVLEFRGRRREVWRTDRYTELFFLDEATAFAAGHRPCAECRWSTYVAYRAAWQRAFGLDAPPLADEMDDVLHRERMRDRHHRRTYQADVGSLPDGTFIRRDSAFWTIDGPVLREWTFGGYRSMIDRADVTGPVEVVTPRPTVEMLRAGYRVGIAPIQ